MPTSFRTEKGILFVTITGKLSLDHALEARAETAEIVKGQAVRRVLGDIRNADVDVSTNDIFQCTAALADLFPSDTKHAVVFSSETCSREDAAFAENVAMNRGVLLKMFSQLDEARDWLLEDGSSRQGSAGEHPPSSLAG